MSQGASVPALLERMAGHSLQRPSSTANSLKKPEKLPAHLIGQHRSQKWGTKTGPSRFLSHIIQACRSFLWKGFQLVEIDSFISLEDFVLQSCCFRPSKSQIESLKSFPVLSSVLYTSSLSLLPSSQLERWISVETRSRQSSQAQSSLQNAATCAGLVPWCLDAENFTFLNSDTSN